MREWLGEYLATGPGQPTTYSMTVSVTFYKQHYLFPFTVYCHCLRIFAIWTTVSLLKATKYRTQELCRYDREEHMPDAHCDLWLVGCGDINCSYAYYAQYILWNIETTEITYQTPYI